jgi:L,D-peptidoglycan transpeptidase YkuD (ErfK/YbiS/YcfS/YnhG family)
MRRVVVSAFAFVSLFGPVSAVAAAPIDGGADAARGAVRDVPWRPGAMCDLATVQALASRHPEVRQFVVLATSTFADTAGQAFAAVRRRDGSWACQTDEMAARFGRSGTRPLIDRRSGDGTTPAGVFALATVTAWDGQRFGVFGNSPDPGVRSAVGYRRVRTEDCWGATPNTVSYNHLVNRPNCAGPDDEWLPKFADVYSHAAVIGANLDPVSGDQVGETPFASAIFLHRHSYATSGATNGPTRPTSGCVSLQYVDLIDVLRLLDPALAPHFAIGPTDWLRSTA